MDDVSNLARVLRTLVLQGAKMEPTGHSEALAGSVVADIGRAIGPRRPAGGTKRQAEAPAVAASCARPRLGDVDGQSGGAQLLADSDLQACPPPAGSATSLSAEGLPGLPLRKSAAASRTRSGQSILAKYSLVQRAEAAGHDALLKGRLPRRDTAQPVATAAPPPGTSGGIRGGGAARRLRRRMPRF